MAVGLRIDMIEQFKEPSSSFRLEDLRGSEVMRSRFQQSSASDVVGSEPF